MSLNRFLFLACVCWLKWEVCQFFDTLESLNSSKSSGIDAFNVIDWMNRTWNVWSVSCVLCFLFPERNQRLPSSAAGVELGIKAVFNASSFRYRSPWNDANSESGSETSQNCSEWMNYWLLSPFLGQFDVGAVEIAPQLPAQPGLLPLRQQSRTSRVQAHALVSFLFLLDLHFLPLPTCADRHTEYVSQETIGIQ